MEIEQRGIVSGRRSLHVFYVKTSRTVRFAWGWTTSCSARCVKERETPIVEYVGYPLSVKLRDDMKGLLWILQLSGRWTSLTVHLIVLSLIWSFESHSLPLRYVSIHVDTDKRLVMCELVIQLSWSYAWTAGCHVGDGGYIALVLAAIEPHNSYPVVPYLLGNPSKCIRMCFLSLEPTGHAQAISLELNCWDLMP